VFGEAELGFERPTLLFLARVDETTHAVTDLGGGCFPLERDANGITRVGPDSAHLRLRAAAGASQLLTGASLPEVRQLLRARGLRAR
jgi:hypothetical protein